MGHTVQVIKVNSMFEARAKLSELGIKFDRTIANVIESGRKQYTGDVIINKGIHRYFMQGDCDVAYYTPLMGLLSVLDAPRKWHEYFLANSVPVGDFE